MSNGDKLWTQMSFEERQTLTQSVSRAAAREAESRRVDSIEKRETRDAESADFKARIADKQYSPSVLRLAYGPTLSGVIGRFGSF